METVKLFKRKKKKVKPQLKADQEEEIQSEEEKSEGSLADLEGKSLADISGIEAPIKNEEPKEATVKSPEIKLKTSNIPALGGENIGVVEESQPEATREEEPVEKVQPTMPEVAGKADKEEVEKSKVDSEPKKVLPSKSTSSNIPSLGKQEEPAKKEKSNPVEKTSIADLAKAETATGTPVIPSVPVNNETADAKNTPSKKSKKKKSLLLPIIGGLISVSIAVGAAYYTTNNKQDTSCTYNGGSYIDGTSFDSTDGCNICNCTAGEVICGVDTCEEEKSTANPKEEDIEESVDAEYVSEVEKDRLYIATLDKKHILYYLSEACENTDGTYIKGSYAQILDNETYFSTACVEPDDLVEIYEVMQLDEDYINTINSYYYNADSNNIYISLFKSTNELGDEVVVDPYIYELNLDNQTSKILWNLDTDAEDVNTNYAYISNKSTETILMFTSLSCDEDDCTQEKPDIVYVINLKNDVVEELGRVYVHSIVDDTVSYKKYDDQFYYPIDNIDAQTFYCSNNPDYWCGDAESVWALYTKIYTKIL